jgi:cytidylate kinase
VQRPANEHEGRRQAQPAQDPPGDGVRHDSESTASRETIDKSTPLGLVRSRRQEDLPRDRDLLGRREAEGTMIRSVEALVDQQARRWALPHEERRRDARRPVITVARQHGARGTDLARRLAEELGFDVFDQEIIHRIAESTHRSERVVKTLDERNRELLTDWLAAFANPNCMSSAEYRSHLTRVVGLVAHEGGAVIVGRGAHLILGKERALRVLAVAPLDARVRTVMERERLCERAARSRIEEVEASRRAFLALQFHAAFADPADFDLVVNTAALGVEGACAVVRDALRLRPSRPLADELSTARL